MSYTRSSQITNTINNTSTFTECKARCRKPTLASAISKQLLKFQNMQQNLQLLKISIKKQVDRRNKLKKLLDTYIDIFGQQKKHVKMIKSSIIQMKDADIICKLKLMVQPTILVQNRIKVQARQFLCTLMNTFYRTYDQNHKNNQIITNLNNTMSFLIKGISFNQDMIFLMQKTQINQQIQLQGQLLLQKNKIKQQNIRKKQINQQYCSIKNTHTIQKDKYNKKKQHIAKLRKQLQQLSQKSQLMKQKIQYQIKLKNQCQDQIDTQILYQNKLKNQLNKLNVTLDSKNRKSQKNLKKLLDYRIQDKFNPRESVGSCKKKNRVTVGVGQQIRQKIKFQIQCQFKSIRG